MAAHLYSAELIGDSTLSYVTTATGVSHQTVAHRLVQECKAVIISHDNPIERMRKLLEILSDEPSGKTLADRISEQVSITSSQERVCTCTYVLDHTILLQQTALVTTCCGSRPLEVGRTMMS